MSGPLNLVIEAKTRKVGSTAAGSAIWPYTGAASENPEFCEDCFALLKAKNWTDLGKRHEASIGRLLEKPPKRADTNT